MCSYSLGVLHNSISYLHQELAKVRQVLTSDQPVGEVGWRPEQYTPLQDMVGREL